MKKRIRITAWRFVCERCGFAWQSTAEKPPITCAKCRSPFWDKQRLRIAKKPSPNEAFEGPPGATGPTGPAGAWIAGLKCPESSEE